MAESRHGPSLYYEDVNAGLSARHSVRAMEVLEKTLAMVRSSRDLVIREDRGYGEIVDLETMRIAALMLVLCVDDEVARTGWKDGKGPLALLKESHRVSCTSDMAVALIDTDSPPSRLTLLDLAVLFGKSDLARGLARLGVDMNLWGYMSISVIMHDEQCDAIAGVLASGRFWSNMISMLDCQNWRLAAAKLRDRVAMSAIRMAEAEVAQTLAGLRIGFGRWLPSVGQLLREGHMSVAWLLKNSQALEAGILAGLDTDLICDLTLFACGWRYSGLCLWEAALLTGNPHAAWSLAKPRAVWPWWDFQGRLKWRDWVWLQSRDAVNGQEAGDVCLSVDGWSQTWYARLEPNRVARAIESMISMSRSWMQGMYGVALLQKVNDLNLVNRILDYSIACPSILLHIGNAN